MSNPALSIVIPIRNEIGNIAPLLDEIEQALAAHMTFEVVYVDDGSTDDSGVMLAKLKQNRSWLRHIRHEQSCGQSAAIRTGVLAARASLVVTLDGDGQNDPAFIPALVKKLEQTGKTTGLVQGQRVGRKDTRSKKLQSRIANAVRGAILQDGIRDTGCGLKAFRRDVYLGLPYFSALHRFMPALVKRDGYTVELVDVVDRPRLTGVSNYGLLDRLWVGIIDLLGVSWLVRRRRSVPTAREVDRKKYDEVLIRRETENRDRLATAADAHMPPLMVRSNHGLLDRLWIGTVDQLGVRWLIRRRGPLPVVHQDHSVHIDLVHSR